MDLPEDDLRTRAKRGFSVITSVSDDGRNRERRVLNEKEFLRNTGDSSGRAEACQKESI